MRKKTLLLSSFAGIVAGLFYMISVKTVLDTAPMNSSTPQQNQVQQKTTPDNNLSVSTVQMVKLS